MEHFPTAQPLNSFDAGFTTKRESQKRNSDFSFVNERREKTQRYSHSAGFTLIELMVVLAIIVTITTIALTSQSSFNKTLILANTAYDIALTLRSAQSFGIGSRATTLGMANAGYGLHFQTGTPGSFILFADTNSPDASYCHGPPPSGDISAPDAQPGNCVYDGVDTLTQTYVLGNGVTISALSANGNSVTSLDIVFARPNPDAFINAGGFSYTAACLTVTSQGGRRFVSVAASGAITVSATSCS